VGDLSPDVTIVLDVDPGVGTLRRGPPADRIEGRGADYHAKVREGFLAEAESNAEKIKIVSAEASIDEVHRMILEVIDSVV